MKFATVSKCAGFAGLFQTFSVLGQTELTFREGLNGYGGTVDTYVSGLNPDTAFANSSSENNSIDADVNNAAEGRFSNQALLRFDGLFGGGPNQIPAGSVISSAVLRIQILNGSADTAASLHLLTLSWDNSSTWNSLAGGIDLGTDALAESAGLLSAPVAAGAQTIDVTASLNYWSAGAANHGWAFLPQDPGGENDNTDGLNFRRSESGTAAERPTLQVTFAAVPEPATAALLVLGGVAVMLFRGTRRPPPGT